MGSFIFVLFDLQLLTYMQDFRGFIDEIEVELRL